MDIHGFRVMRHCGANTGFAIAPLEKTFYRRALALTGGDSQRAHFSHPRLGGVQPSTLPVAFANVRELGFRSRDSTTLRAMAEYNPGHRISTGLGFDVPVTAPALGRLREALTKEVGREGATCA